MNALLFCSVTFNNNIDGVFCFFLNFFKQLCLGVHCNNSKFTYLKLMNILFKLNLRNFTISNLFLFFKQDEDVKRVFLPPPAYRPYTPNKLDSPHLSTHKAYLSDSRSYIDDDRETSWQYEGTQSI